MLRARRAPDRLSRDSISPTVGEAAPRGTCAHPAKGAT